MLYENVFRIPAVWNNSSMFVSDLLSMDDSVALSGSMLPSFEILLLVSGTTIFVITGPLTVWIVPKYRYAILKQSFIKSSIVRLLTERVRDLFVENGSSIDNFFPFQF